MMTSPDYKERFKAEYRQTSIRAQKLKSMLDKWESNELNFTPACPKELLEEQLTVMTKYLDILHRRGRIESVW